MHNNKKRHRHHTQRNTVLYWNSRKKTFFYFHLGDSNSKAVRHDFHFFHLMVMILYWKAILTGSVLIACFFFIKELYSSLSLYIYSQQPENTLHIIKCSIVYYALVYCMTSTHIYGVWFFSKLLPHIWKYTIVLS